MQRANPSAEATEVKSSHLPPSGETSLTPSAPLEAVALLPPVDEVCPWQYAISTSHEQTVEALQKLYDEKVPGADIPFNDSRYDDHWTIGDTLWHIAAYGDDTEEMIKIFQWLYEHNIPGIHAKNQANESVLELCLPCASIPQAKSEEEINESVGYAYKLLQFLHERNILVSTACNVWDIVAKTNYTSIKEQALVFKWLFDHNVPGLEELSEEGQELVQQTVASGQLKVAANVSSASAPAASSTNVVYSTLSSAQPTLAAAPATPAASSSFSELSSPLQAAGEGRPSRTWSLSAPRPTTTETTAAAPAAAPTAEPQARGIPRVSESSSDGSVPSSKRSCRGGSSSPG